jgi:hypothetical protein
MRIRSVFAPYLFVYGEVTVKNTAIRNYRPGDTLVFWQEHESKFPILTYILQDYYGIQYYYAIPASNTTVERLFSSSKNTASDRRTRVATEKDIMLLQKNLSMLKNFRKASVNEIVDIQLKRKIAESSSSTSVQNEEQNSCSNEN